MKQKSFVMMILLVLPTSIWAQAGLFTFNITNVADIPLGGTNTIRISFSYVSGTNWLSAEGINTLDVGIRMVNPITGSVSTVNAVPTIGPATPPSDIGYNIGFNGAQAAYAPSNGFFESVAGYTNVVGFSLAASGSTGVGTGSSSLFLADIRLRGDVLGQVQLQAYFLNPSRATDINDPFFPDGQIYTSQFKDLGTLADGGFGQTDAGFATFFVTSVPEPTTWALIILSFASGVAGIVWYRRRQLQLANNQLQLAEEGLVEVE